MFLKTNVDIVAGSRTRDFINTMIRSEKLANEEIVILRSRTAHSEIDALRDVHIIEYSDPALNTVFLAALLKNSTFDRLIIEYSGRDFPHLFNMLESSELTKTCRIHKVFFTIECLEFAPQYERTAEIYEDGIDMSDVVVRYHSRQCNKDKLAAISAIVKSINPHARVLEADLKNSSLIHEQLAVKRKSAFDFFLIPICLLAAAYLIYQLYRAFLPQGLELSPFTNLITVFLSILYEAFPFILIGILVSSFIQVLIPSAILEKLFTKNKPIAYLTALFAGIIFPVCDCASVPVAARLVKKGVPVPIAVTFYLAAPIVNPIVIASTLYAFPSQPSVALLRVVLGLLVALIAGLVIPRDTSDILNTARASARGCGCTDGHHHEKDRPSRLREVLKHAAEEFFEVGIYLIIGALISSVIQTVVPKNIMASLGGSIVLSILSMMLAAFILSICSTSDAFIARTFASSLPMASVMGFMVLGPMLDLKNLFLLLGQFKKRFVLKLVSTVTVIAFFILLIFTFSF
jgi:uncharacterized membrane protein YraQ (UPF0718 family)